MREKIVINGTTFRETSYAALSHATRFKAKNKGLHIEVAPYGDTKWYLLVSDPKIGLNWNSLWQEKSWPTKEEAMEYVTSPDFLLPVSSPTNTVNHV